MPMGTGTYGSEKGRPPKKERKKKMGGGKNMKNMDRSINYSGGYIAGPN